MSDLFNIPLEEARDIRNLAKLDIFIDRIQKRLAGNPILLQQRNPQFLRKLDQFSWRYYGASLGFGDHFHRFQEMTVIQLKNLHHIPEETPEGIIAHVGEVGQKRKSDEGLDDRPSEAIRIRKVSNI